MTYLWESEDPPPKYIGPYEVRGVIGVGGMSAVYACWDAASQRSLAIKTCELSSLGGRERFRREARLLAGLSHSNLVAIHDYGEEEGVGFMVMPHLKGESLADRVKRSGVLEHGEAAALLEPIARALDYLHRQGIVHRDVKPSNVVLHETGPVLIDLGVALSSEHSLRLTRSAGVVGTPAFMAPEQWEGGQVDARTDVFGLGGTLHFALTGLPPPPALTGLDLEGQLGVICGRCLEPDPERRYPSCRQVAEELAAPVSASRVFAGAAVAVCLFAVCGLAVAALGLLNPEAPTPSPLSQSQAARVATSGVARASLLLPHSGVKLAAFAGSEGRFLTCSEESVRFWSSRGGALRSFSSSSPSGEPESLVAGDRVAAYRSGGVLRVLDIRSGAVLWRRDLSPRETLAVSPSLAHVAYTQSQSIVVCAGQTGQLEQVLSAPSVTRGQLAWSDRGEFLVAVAVESRESVALALWERSGGRLAGPRLARLIRSEPDALCFSSSSGGVVLFRRGERASHVPLGNWGAVGYRSFHGPSLQGRARLPRARAGQIFVLAEDPIAGDRILRWEEGTGVSLPGLRAADVLDLSPGRDSIRVLSSTPGGVAVTELRFAALGHDSTDRH